MSAQTFGAINLISGLIFLLLGAAMLVAGYGELEDIMRYGDVEMGIILVLTGYLFVIFALWGILCGIVATIAGMVRSGG